MEIFKHSIGGVFSMVLILGAFGMEGCRSDLAALLPEEIKGWKVAQEDRIYDRDTLYDYIDGGAELYLSYGFKRVVSRTYSTSGRPDVVVDLFDMGTSQEAFGVFSHGMETVDDMFGQGSLYTEGMLLFWKDRFFVSILAFPETPESKRAVLELSRTIETAIPEEGPLPEILALLPQQGLVRESIRYFHHHVWLNSHYFIADQNILHIDERTDAVLARYGEPEKRCLLLLVNYRNEHDAQRAYEDFATHYLPELSQDRIVQIEDGTWTACQRTGALLALVFNASTKDRASRLMQAVQDNLGTGERPIEEEKYP